MDIETNDFFYIYTCPECGGKKEVIVKVPKNLPLPDEFRKTKIPEMFCPNNHKVILPEGKISYTGDKIVLSGNSS
jgi:uncharacterized Zn finger protein